MSLIDEHNYDDDDDDGRGDYSAGQIVIDDKRCVISLWYVHFLLHHLID